jgi:hypothetical protein
VTLAVHLVTLAVQLVGDCDAEEEVGTGLTWLGEKWEDQEDRMF